MRGELLTPEARAEIRERYAAKDRRCTQIELAAEFGVSQGTIWSILQEAEPRPPSTPRKRAGIGQVITDTYAERDWRRLRRLIPEDTRDYTQRFCGDPLPGRSALDRRAGA